MNTTKIGLLIILCLAIIPDVPLCAVEKSDKQTSYNIQIIKNIIPELQYIPIAINNNGDALFQMISRYASTWSYIWKNGKMINLKWLGYKEGENLVPEKHSNIDPRTLAYALNDNGQVVGQAFYRGDLNNPHAFIWENGKMTDLGTLGGKTSRAMGINNKGQVVGGADDAHGLYRPFIWDKKNGMRKLGSDLKEGNAWFINEKGQIIGQTVHREYYLWQNGKLVPPSKINNYSPRAFNNKGELVGVGNDGVYVYKQGKWVKINLEYFDSSCKITGFTDSGMVAGCGTYDYYITGFLWKDARVVKAKDLVPADTGWTFSSSLPFVNNKGQIVMNGLYNGELCNAILTPNK